MRCLPLKSGQWTFVDDEDYDFLSRYKWHLLSGKYAGTKIWQQKQDAQRKPIGPRFRVHPELISDYMHRIIMKAPGGIHVDHINGDCLDNQRSNLRLCEHYQNLANRGLQQNNTSGHKGVSQKNGRWRARLHFQGRELYLGTFDTPEEASAAYDRAVMLRLGDFAVTNASLRQEHQT